MPSRQFPEPSPHIEKVKCAAVSDGFPYSFLCLSSITCFSDRPKIQSRIPPHRLSCIVLCIATSQTAHTWSNSSGDRNNQQHKNTSGTNISIIADIPEINIADSRRFYLFQYLAFPPQLLSVAVSSRSQYLPWFHALNIFLRHFVIRILPTTAA